MTSRVKGIVLSVILVVIALLLMPIVVSGVHQVQTDPYIATFAGTTVDNGSAADGTGTMTGSPVSLTPGVNTPTITVAGTFTVTLPVGMTGTATTGEWVVTGSPKALVAGANTVTVEAGGGPGGITISVTGGGTATVTLNASHLLYEGRLGNINSITSDSPSATPIAHSYVTATRVLTIRGLNVASPQTLTVNYDEVANAAYSGVNSVVGLIPLLVVVGIIIIAIINGFWSLKKGD